MNLLFFILNLPFEIDLFLPSYFVNNDLFSIIVYVFYISYAINFYVLMLTNSTYRYVFASFFYESNNNTIEMK